MLPSVILSFAVLVLIILSPFLFILIVYTLPGSNITDNYINPSDLPLYFVGYFLIGKYIVDFDHSTLVKFEFVLIGFESPGKSFISFFSSHSKIKF